MGSLGIRAATVLDAERLAVVHEQCVRESGLAGEIIDQSGLEDRYERALSVMDATSTWVATWDGEIVGFVSATALGPGHVRMLELSSLGVLASHRNRGIGSKLLNHAVGTAPCLAWAPAGAESFYRRHGFEADSVTETRDGMPFLRLLR